MNGTVSAFNACQDDAHQDVCYLLPANEAGETEKYHPVIHDIGPVCNVPEHWERDYFLVDGIPIYYYIARAKNEHGLMVGCSGLKSDRPITANSIEAYNKAGISVIMMALPNPGRSLGFMPYFRKVFQQFALDDSSPAHTLFNSDIPKFLYGHSTGGQILTRLLHTQQHAADLKKKYIMANAEVPFYDTANASRYSPSFQRNAFNAYACMNQNALPKETLGGLFYLHFNERKNKLHTRLPPHEHISLSSKAVLVLSSAVQTLKELYLPIDDKQPKAWFQRENEYRTPTYGQILEDKHEGQKLVRWIQRKARKSPIPFTIIATKEDPFSCPITTERDIVKPLKANFYLADKGQHNPLSEDPQALAYAIKQMIPHLRKESSNKTDPKSLPERWTITTLGRRFGNAFQNSTRLLNPLASYFKLLG